MLDFKKIFKKEKKVSRNYFEMSSADKVKILRKAVKKANEDQLGLIRRYEKKFGEKVDLSECKN